MTKGEKTRILKRLDKVLRECEALRQEVLNEEPEVQEGHTGMMYGGYPRYEGFGLSLSGPAWSRLSGIPRNTLWKNLRKGLTIEEIYAKRGLPAPPTE